MTGIIIIAWTFGPHYIGFTKKIHTQRERGVTTSDNLSLRAQRQS